MPKTTLPVGFSKNRPNMLPRLVVLCVECLVPLLVPLFVPRDPRDPPPSPARMRAMTFHGFASSAAMASSARRRSPSLFHHQLTPRSARKDTAANAAYTSMNIPASLSAEGDEPPGLPERLGNGPFGAAPDGGAYVPVVRSHDAM